MRSNLAVIGWWMAGAAAMLAEPNARMEAQRAGADFELTADARAAAWSSAKVTAAAVDPWGKPAGAGKAFEVRALWTPQYLYFLFSCPYDTLNLKANPVTAEETNRLWLWDVAEVFLGWDVAAVHKYRELQVSPQGEWVDLDIDRKAPKRDGWKWNSGMQVKARIAEGEKVWYGAMKIPWSAIDGKAASAGREYPINIYRLTGAEPNRSSTMWTPVHEKSHHTPEMFGRLILGPGK